MSLTLEDVQAQEAACVLPAFDSTVAWALGARIRAYCQRRAPPARPAVVSVAHANASQLLFFATTGAGTTPESVHFVQRKEAAVRRWGVSTMQMHLRIRAAFPGADVQDVLRDKFELADPSAYACYGGGFPVRVKNVEGLVGVVVVSGMEEEEDHDAIVRCLQDYLAEHGCN